jgi:putative ABC transport system permease protein
MRIHPTIAALRRHKAGTLLIALQIAFTLAIVCNAIFIINQSYRRMSRVTGIDEADVFMVETTQPGVDVNSQAGRDSINASIRADLAAIKSLPTVSSAYETNSLSLTNEPWTLGLRRTPEARTGASTGFFNADENTIQTLGLHLVAGRNFQANEITSQGQLGLLQPSVIIISSQLAQSLFPNETALGKQLYFSGPTSPSLVVGIVDRMQTSASNSSTDSATWNSTLVPIRLAEASRYYVVRSKSGQIASAMKAVEAALYEVDPMRVIPKGTRYSPRGIRSFDQIRDQAYKNDRTLSLLMVAISVILLLVTGSGIAGLISFWVTQRRRQIGVRRAVGATRKDIVRYFLGENAFIALLGIALGVALAFFLNHKLMTWFELGRLPVSYAFIAAAALFLVSLGAALAPAMRASRIDPATAMRTR